MNSAEEHKPANLLTILREDGVAFLLLNHPPVNASSAALRAALYEGLQESAHDSSIIAVVIMGQGQNFMAGADIREFDGPLLDPQMPAIIQLIENLNKPVIAAIHGAALGAGFELALACDARMATPHASIGLPEVSLGVIPGAGGTQRLPRLIGTAKALDLIGNAKRVKGSEAVDLGMIDRLCTTELKTEAKNFALECAKSTGKKRLRDRDHQQVSNSEVNTIVEKLRKKSEHAPAVTAAVESIILSQSLPFDEGLSQERATFQKLRHGYDASARRHLFFAEREATRIPGIESIQPLQITQTCVIGGGTMGAGIAVCFLDAGFPVTLIERDEVSLDQGSARIRAIYERNLASGRQTAKKVEENLGHLSTTCHFDEVRQADLVIEAVFEDFDVKTTLMRELDHKVKPSAILASNTSYLDLNRLASVTSRPQNVIGLHFFAPAHIMKLLEIVRTQDTSLSTLATAMDIARKIRKTPVVARVCEGFIGNRIYSAYRKQCEFMLEEGALPFEVDAALTDFGFAMGPFAVADLSGLDIAWRTRQRQAATRDPQERYSDILDRLCEAGRVGLKAGKGWYTYPDGTRRGVADPWVKDVIEDASRRKGFERRSIPADEIVNRALISIINEAALLLSEGIAERASDVDLVMVTGYGFPTHIGGPLFWAQHEPEDKLTYWTEILAQSIGHRFKKADLKWLHPGL